MSVNEEAASRCGTTLLRHGLTLRAKPSKAKQQAQSAKFLRSIGPNKTRERFAPRADCSDAGV
jgi:hypothetical protein